MTYPLWDDSFPLLVDMTDKILGYSRFHKLYKSAVYVLVFIVYLFRRNRLTMKPEISSSKSVSRRRIKLAKEWARTSHTKSKPKLTSACSGENRWASIDDSAISSVYTISWLINIWDLVASYRLLRRRVYSVCIVSGRFKVLSICFIPFLLRRNH